MFLSTIKYTKKYFNFFNLHANIANCSLRTPQPDCHSFLVLSLISRSPGDGVPQWVLNEHYFRVGRGILIISIFHCGMLPHPTVHQNVYQIINEHLIHLLLLFLARRFPLRLNSRRSWLRCW